MVHDGSRPEHTHERSDVSIGLLRNFLIVLAVGLVILLGSLGLFWKLLGSNLDRPTTSRWEAPRELPQGPRLQTAPETDLKSYLEKQRQQLGSYAWVDAPSVVVQIPVEQAIRLTVERGLPSRQQSPPRGSDAQASR